MMRGRQNLQGSGRAIFLLFLTLILTLGGEALAFAAEPVFFVSDLFETSNMDIYMTDPDNPGLVVRLTTNPEIDNHPELSPDGTKLVWSSTRESNTHPLNLNSVSNAQKDFELFIADYSEADTVTVERTARQMTKDESSTPDRHPHWSPDGQKIVFDAKDNKVCWPQTTRIEISECSQPRWIEVINEVCKDFERMNIMDATDTAPADKRGDNNIKIDMDIADTGANVWPDDDPRTERPDESQMTYVGHPSFSPTGDRIVFSAAVDGQGDSGGEDWEVYMINWDSSTSVASNLRRLTLGTKFNQRANKNKIRMTGGAHFTSDGSIVLSSQRTEEGNSQLFKITSTTVGSVTDEPVDVGGTLVGRITTQTGNYYVPEELDDGRLLVTSDRGFTGAMCSLPVFTLRDLTDGTHTISIAATDTKNAESSGTLINVDGFDIETPGKIESIAQTDTAIVYTGSWDSTSGASATGEEYKLSANGDTETVTLDFDGTGITWYAFTTQESGKAEVSVDGGTTETIDLYQEGPTADLDLTILSTTSTATTKLTDNNYNDEMSMIGDEVSWFCGAPPNLTSCSSFPKLMTPESLSIMRWEHWYSVNGGHYMREGFQGRDLYAQYFGLLDNYMRTKSTTDEAYWDAALLLGAAPAHNDSSASIDHIHDPAEPEEHLVLRAPFMGAVYNNPPTTPTVPSPADSSADEAQSLTLSWDDSTEPDGSETITYDVYFGKTDPPVGLIQSNTTTADLPVSDLEPGTPYFWRVVAKDSRRGLTEGPVWSFLTETAPPTGVNLTILALLGLTGFAAGIIIVTGAVMKGKPRIA